MRLKVYERIVLGNILKQFRGDITAVRIVHDLQMALSFSEKERKALNFRVKPEGGMEWKTAADNEKNIIIGETGMYIISNSFKTLSKQGKLSTENIAIYDKFVKEDPKLGEVPKPKPE